MNLDKLHIREALDNIEDDKVRLQTEDSVKEYLNIRGKAAWTMCLKTLRRLAKQHALDMPGKTLASVIRGALSDDFADSYRRMRELKGTLVRIRVDRIGKVTTF